MCHRRGWRQAVSAGRAGGQVLTIAKLSRWSINYYNDTARAAGQAAKDAQRANGGLGEYYSERDTRTPVWVCAGDAVTVWTTTALDLEGFWHPRGRCLRAGTTMEDGVEVRRVREVVRVFAGLVN